jgi:hypothetical protein
MGASPPAKAERPRATTYVAPEPLPSTTFVGFESDFHFLSDVDCSPKQGIVADVHFPLAP